MFHDIDVSQLDFMGLVIRRDNGSGLSFFIRTQVLELNLYNILGTIGIFSGNRKLVKIL